MTKPNAIPTWATDPLLTGGPQIGLSPRLDPGAGIRAQGIYQGHKVPGRGLGWMLGMSGDWLTYLDALTQHAALRRWTHTSIFGNNTDPVGQHLVALLPQGGVGLAVQNPAVVGVFGTHTFDSHAMYAVSADGLNFSGGLPGFTSAYSAIAADTFGVAFGGLLGVATCKTVDYNGATGTFTPGNSAQVEAAHFGSGHYLIAAAGIMYRASSLGGAWTNTTSIGSVGDTVQDIVDNGDWPNSIVPTVLALTKTVASNGHHQALYSTDDGLTWTLGHDFGSALLSLTWSPWWGLFVIVDTTNAGFWTSPDGAVWTKQKTIGATGFAGGTQRLAACSACIAHVVNRSATGGADLQGVAYTFDLGATWQEFYFGALASQPIRCLMEANGRFFASDDFNVYVSGELVTPVPLYLGS